MRLFSSAAARRRSAALLVAVAAALAALYAGLRRYAPFVLHPEELRAWIEGFGVLAPVVFVLFQTVQVVVAPIPGQVVALVAGYLFGPVAGTVYSLVGVLLGSAIAFMLADRYGRGFVEEVLDEEVVERFDGFVDRVGVPGLLAFVVIPGLPDDAICFLAGITNWRLRTFMAAITVGRLPAYVLTVYAGGKLASGRFVGAMAIFGAIVAISVVGYVKQKTIRNLVRRFAERASF
ncbi:TVP38/TMEM64 family protein [Halogeometricum sp. S1BR25-6]|uniref:TVP38/TMEM64 family protein n=1 Tax=Halogeometricum salsisoli TaxID=2950536 RepID=A0ABU2GKM5_9EURY|nr:TVP38/TMEM64 family protein [Halogeometricum sp. S1BR25-6]MDS0300744.1 TVP38/TMEM64 family protein [Halogeometricum sp. S1BR25-6]